MISPKRIPPPLNWQDFELLALKLWGEIWSIPNEIEFNSGIGLNQKGVDVFGIPKNEKEYFGVQCKNKKFFSKNGKLNKLTKADINEEIEKAKEFKPRLRKLIIATSLEKDEQLEEYVREINLKHIEKNLFSIQICFWDFFSRKILEYEKVYNWYVKHQIFETSKSICVSFEDDKTEFSISPEFIKTDVVYRLQTNEEKRKEEEEIRNSWLQIQQESKISFLNKLFSFRKRSLKKGNRHKRIFINGVDIRSQQYIESTYPREKVESLTRPKIGVNIYEDKQEFSFKIKLKNDGNTVIDDFKFSFQLEGDFDDAKVATPRIRELNDYIPTTWLNSKFGFIEPPNNFIVQKDSFVSKEIIITPKLATEGKIKIKWALLARDFNEDGELIIHVKPTYIRNEKTMYVLKQDQCREDIEFSYKTFEGSYEPNW